MSKWPTALFLLSLLTTCVPLRAQQSFAIAHDPAPDTQAPTQNLETVIDFRGSHIMGMLLLASGTQGHGTVILLHGFSGYEQNMDLAQALRRDGWNVLAMHYRGSWGSEGTFSFTNCMEDVGTMLAYVSEPANSAKFHVDLRRIVVIGHSMGGFMAVAALAQHPQIAAGVVITEGSPVVDGPGYFGKDSDPADTHRSQVLRLLRCSGRRRQTRRPGPSQYWPQRSPRVRSSTSLPTTDCVPRTNSS